MIEVAYVTHSGTDLLVANAARRSFDNQHTAWSDTPRTRRGRSDRQLIADLAAEGHTLPFRHCQVTLACTAPLPVARQLGKHQVGFCLSGDAEVTFSRLVRGRSNGVRTVTMRDLHAAWSGEASKYHRGASGRHQVSRRHVRVLNTETGLFETAHIASVTASGPKPVYRVTLADGASLKMSKDHRIYTESGWQTLEQAVGLVHRAGGVAAMSRPCRVGRNGTTARGTETYRDRPWMAAQRASGASLAEIANAAACGTDNVRKWLRIHGLQFDHLANLQGVNGQPVWNKGLTGYRVRRIFTEQQREAVRAARSGPKSNFWRGGVTPERANITRWTAGQAQRVHRRFSFTCQGCGSAGGDLVAHHIVPVHADISMARVFDNLVSVCRTCHSQIHRSPEAEMAFAETLRARGMLVPAFHSERCPNPGNTLRVHFVDVAKVEYAGIEETFDLAIDHPSHNFVANGFVVHNSWSEVSRRYITKNLTLHEIEAWRTAPVEKRQGSGAELDDRTNALLRQSQARVHSECLRAYDYAIAMGASPEQARFLLPQSMDVRWTWTGSLLGWWTLVRGRTHPDAQAETREFAQRVEEVVSPLFPVSWAALAGWRPSEEAAA